MLGVYEVPSADPLGKRSVDEKVVDGRLKPLVEGVVKKSATMLEDGLKEKPPKELKSTAINYAIAGTSPIANASI
jgi:hypothetical protein